MLFLNQILSTEHEANRADSLLLPPKVTLSYLTPDKWTFIDVQPEEPCVCEIHAINSAPGFEDVGYQFKAEQIDLDLLANGDKKIWRQRKEDEFKESLLLKRKQFLQQLQKSLKTAIGD